MRLEYDREADAAYLYLVEEQAAASVSRTVPCIVEDLRAELFLDIDSSGHVTGIEILGARAVLPAEALQAAQPP
jgi:uncharacterized protein YuzE